jgi:hypothetical protein
VNARAPFTFEDDQGARRIDPNWPDWRAGRDPVMDWILQQ